MHYIQPTQTSQSNMSNVSYDSYESGQASRHASTMEWDPSWPNHPRDPTSIPISRNTSNPSSLSIPSTKNTKASRARPRIVRRPDERQTNSERQQTGAQSARAAVSHLVLNNEDDEDDGLMSASSDETNLESPAAQAASMQGFFLSSVWDNRCGTSQWSARDFFVLLHFSTSVATLSACLCSKFANYQSERHLLSYCT